MFSSKNTDLELANSGEVVVSRVFKIYEPNGRAMLAGLLVLADAGVFQQQVQQVLVVFDQAVTGKAARELLDDFLDLIVFQPRIDHLELRAQHLRQDDFGEVLASGVGGLLLLVSQVDDVPAESVELFEQRQLDVVSLVEFDVLRCFVAARHGDDLVRSSRRIPTTA